MKLTANLREETDSLKSKYTVDFPLFTAIMCYIETSLHTLGIIKPLHRFKLSSLHSVYIDLNGLVVQKSNSIIIGV